MKWGLKSRIQYKKEEEMDGKVGHHKKISCKSILETSYY